MGGDEAGLSVTELHTSWLTVIPEEAVIQARVTPMMRSAPEKLNGEVVKILAALRANGYEPHLRVQDVTVGGGGDLPEWTPTKPDVADQGERTRPAHRTDSCT